MTTETTSEDVARRAAVHRALGDEHRLAIVDALRLSDQTPTELREQTGLASNLLAFHLDVLEDVGLVRRSRSQGDGRRRYVSLWQDPGTLLRPDDPPTADHVVFVCTANAARSQLAAGLWSHRTGRRAVSAGTDPADRVHPLAVAVARRHGLDLSAATPRHVDDLEEAPDLVVSVCDRAHETGVPVSVRRLHWSVPDPDGGEVDAFEAAFAEIDRRVDRLAAHTR